MAPRLVDQLADVFLCMAIFFHQLAIAFGFLDGVQILALNILDQCDFSRPGIVDVTDDCGDGVKSGGLGCAPTTLAGDDLEPAIRGWSEPGRSVDRRAKPGDDDFVGMRMGTRKSAAFLTA